MGGETVTGHRVENLDEFDGARVAPAGAVLLRHRLRLPGELIANGLAVEEIRASIDADSLAYISLEGLVAASEQPLESLCRAYFDGVYPSLTRGTIPTPRHNRGA